MASHSQNLAIVITAQDLASGKLSKVRSELAGMGTAGKIASVGLGTGMLAVTKGEQALGNFKNRLTSLAAPLAMIGLSGGLFSVAGALEQGVTKAQDLALGVEKVTGATTLGTHAASQAVAVFGKYGLSADQTATMLGRLEKNAFTAANTSKLATKFQTEYGLSLTDSKGHIKDTTALLGTLSDYYLKNTNIAQRDAAMAKLLGKNWIELVPILKQGAAGYAAAAVEADKLGLTLKSQADVTNVNAFVAAERKAKDAVGGLEVQLGLLVMPDIAAGLTAFTDYLVNHKDEVQQFFADGLHVAEALGGFITGTLVPAISSVAGAATGIWNSIPGPMKDLLVKGVVADRTLKFFFGMSPIHYVVGLAEGAFQKGLSGLVGALMGRGSPVNPMFVKDIGLGGLGGGAVATAEGEAMGLTAGGIMATALTAALAVGLAYFADDIQKFLGTDYAHNQNLPLNQLSWPWGPKNTPKIDLGPWKNILGGDSSLPPTGPSSSGGTGGNVGSDRYPTQTGGLKAVNQLSGGMSGLLAGGTIGAAGVGMANSIAGVFAQSTSPSLHSMTSAMQQMKDMQARYLAQGDTKLAASIGVDLAAVRAAVDRTTSAINAKQFVATTLSQVLPMFFPKTPPKAPAAVPVTIRDVNIGNNSRKAYGPDRKI